MQEYNDVLAGELKQVRTAMSPKARGADQQRAVAALEQAEEAVERGDSQGALSNLKTALASWGVGVVSWAGRISGAAVLTKLVEKLIG